MDTRLITADAVRHALRAVRFERSLGSSPLLGLDALADRLAERGGAGSHLDQEAGLEQLLGDVVWEQLCRLRGDAPPRHRPALSPEAEIALLCRDFKHGKPDVEGWSVVYHRYFASDRTPVGEIAARLGITDKTFERRLNRGHELLAARLRQLEDRAALTPGAPDARRLDDGSPTPAPPLPLPLTAFVGRASDLGALRELVADHRLVTLTGPGGIGKTRLALEFGRALAEGFTGGVWWVDLAGVTEEAQVPRALAQALGVTERQGQPLVDGLVEHLRAPARLVILDNCEHVREACGLLLAALLARCEGLHVLATSREPLHLVGEQLWPVAPLALPDGDGVIDLARLAAFEAVALFTARAREARPDFSLSDANAEIVARICARLDGIPLALELAAARVRALDVVEIDRRLDQRFRLLTRGVGTTAARHQTLKAAIDWGHELLDEAERVLLRRLAVFRGGWAIEAAEAVCGGDGRDGTAMGGGLDSADVLDGVTALVDKSFVMRGRSGADARFRLLETIRDYAWDRLVASGEAPRVCDLHLAWCTAVAEAAEPELLGASQATWLRRLDIERDNVRAAIEWGAGMGHAEDLGLRLGAALGRYWLMRGHLTEGREQLGKLLAASAEPTTARARALAAGGSLARQQCDYEAALRLFEESLAIEREAGNEAGIAGLLREMGNVAEEQGDDAGARERYEACLALYRKLGHRWGTAAALNNLGIVNSHRGASEAAAPLLEESLALFRELGEQWAVGATLFNLGHVHLDQGDVAAAEACYAQSLEIARAIGDQEGIASAISGLGNVALRREDFAAARRSYGESIAVLADLGDKQAIAECLEALAAADRAEGDDTTAVRRLAAADALREAIGAPVTQKGRAEMEDRVAALRAALGEVAFAAMWAEGRGMGWREMVG